MGIMSLTASASILKSWWDGFNTAAVAKALRWLDGKVARCGCGNNGWPPIQAYCGERCDRCGYTAILADNPCKLTPRKLRLFVVACARAGCLLIGRNNTNIRAAEDFADGTPHQMAEAFADSEANLRRSGWGFTDSLARFAVFPDERLRDIVHGFDSSPGATASPDVWNLSHRVIWPECAADRLRCIARPPFARLGSWAPGKQAHEIVTREAMRIAEAVYWTTRNDDGELDPLGVLAVADRLEENGCRGVPCDACKGTGTVGIANGWAVDPPVCCPDCGGARNLPHPALSHLRGPGPHVRGCHALDWVLHKE